MPSGSGGSVGMCFPSGKKPLSSAVYEMEYTTLSGPVYLKNPLDSSNSESFPCFDILAVSSAKMLFSVSYLKFTLHWLISDVVLTQLFSFNCRLKNL